MRIILDDIRGGSTISPKPRWPGMDLIIPNEELRTIGTFRDDERDVEFCAFAPLRLHSINRPFLTVRAASCISYTSKLNFRARISVSIRLAQNDDADEKMQIEKLPNTNISFASKPNDDYFMQKVRCYGWVSASSSFVYALCRTTEQRVAELTISQQARLTEAFNRQSTISNF